jgi:hypothetical protein
MPNWSSVLGSRHRASPASWHSDAIPLSIIKSMWGVEKRLWLVKCAWRGGTVCKKLLATETGRLVVVDWLVSTVVLQFVHSTSSNRAVV